MNRQTIAVKPAVCHRGVGGILEIPLRHPLYIGCLRERVLKASELDRII